MKKSERPGLYFDLFSLIVDEPRIPPKGIATHMNMYYKPRSAFVYTQHLQTMYENGISKAPEITLKPYLGAEIAAYFCRKTDEKNLYTMFIDLYRDKRVLYVVLLSGCDFLFTTRNKEIEYDLHQYDLEVVKASNIYTPVYTIPKGWNLSMDDAITNVMDYDFKKGLLERKVYRGLGWSALDWDIYHLMRPNIREKFIVISKKTGVFLSTVKRHFYNKILPKCVVIHRFFPKGFNNYLQMVLRIRSRYERAIAESLKELPCSNIVFPLESELIIFLYHENTRKILKMIQKMEEIGVIDTYRLYNPLASGTPD